MVITLHVQEKYKRKLERLSREVNLYDKDSLLEFLIDYYDYMKNYYAVYHR